MKFGFGSSIDLWIQAPPLERLIRTCVVKLAYLICLCLFSAGHQKT